MIPSAKGPGSIIFPVRARLARSQSLNRQYLPDKIRACLCFTPLPVIASKETGSMRDATMSRRLFLGGTVASGALLGLGSRVAWAAGESRHPAAGTIGDFKISLAEWSLHKALFAKKVDNLDFPRIAREEYGIEGVEFVNQFFKDKAHDSVYL